MDFATQQRLAKEALARRAHLDGRTHHQRAHDRVLAHRMSREVSPTIRGEGRIRLVDKRLWDEARLKSPRASRGEIHNIVMARGLIDHDTGWVGNTATDLSRVRLANNATIFAAAGSALDQFIHESIAPSNARRFTIQFIYSNQSPQNQIDARDTGSDDEALLLQSWTNTFLAPSVERDINMTGLTTLASVDASQDAIHGLLFYTALGSTVVQTVVQNAVVQYRLTWSLD